MGTNTAPRFCTLQQAEADYGTAVKTLRLWVATGRLSAFKPGRRVLVDRDELERLVLAHPHGPSAKAAEAEEKAA